MDENTIPFRTVALVKLHGVLPELAFDLPDLNIEKYVYGFCRYFPFLPKPEHVTVCQQLI